MSELGARFRREMVLRGFSPRTVESYERAMVDLIAGCGGRSPDQLTKEDVQRHLQRLIEVRQLEWSTVNVYFSAYRLFYYRVLNRTESQFSIPPRGRSKHLPWVPDRPTVRAILGAPGNLKHRALLIMTYGSGLRVSEVCRLKPWHIESSPERMLVRVEQGKGRKDRYTLLSQRALDLLREYWRRCQPGREWLFFGRDRTQAISIGTVQAVFYQACRKAGVECHGGIHSLRHAFATHLMEDGAPIHLIKRFLGHSALATTAQYCHVTAAMRAKLRSPLDSLYVEE